MSKVNQVKKSKYLRCKTDKTQCRIRCPKCELFHKSHSKLFKTPENLWRHLYQVHSIDRNSYPSIDQVIEVLEKISIALHNHFPLTTIPLAVKWRMIIQ